MRVMIHGRPPVLLALLIVFVVVSAGCGDDGGGAADGTTPPTSPTDTGAGTTETGTTETGGEDPGTVPIVTQDDGNRTVAIAVDGEARIQLGGGLTWDQPLVRGDADAIDISPVNYFADPGFVEYAVRGVRPGEAVISASGSPDGGGRPQRFEVTILVEG